jgi:hypothetical protein
MSTQVRRYVGRTGVAPVPPGVPPGAGALAGTHCKDKWTDALKFQGSGTRQDAGRDGRDGCSPRQLPLVSWEVLPGINGVRVKVIAWHHLKFPII